MMLGMDLLLLKEICNIIRKISSAAKQHECCHNMLGINYRYVYNFIYVSICVINSVYLTVGEILKPHKRDVHSDY